MNMTITVLKLLLMFAFTSAHLSERCTFVNISGKEFCVTAHESQRGKTFDEAATFCRKNFDGTLPMYDLASLKLLELLRESAPFQWIGLRKEAGKIWMWMDENPLIVEEARWNENTLPYISGNDHSDLCAASNIRESNLTWFQFDCTEVLDHWMCQRPRRNKCHVFIVQSPCQWVDDERCASVIETKTQDGDAGSKCDPALATIAYKQCQESVCGTCRFTEWSEWAECRCHRIMNYFYNSTVRYRKLENLRYEEYSPVACLGFSLVQKKLCNESVHTNICHNFMATSVSDSIEYRYSIITIIGFVGIAFGVLIILVGVFWREYRLWPKFFRKETAAPIVSGDVDNISGETRLEAE